MKYLIQIAIISIIILMTGCFEYEEELWLNRDNSGSLTFVMGIDESLLTMLESESEKEIEFSSEKLRKELDAYDGIKINNSITYNDKGKKWVKLNLEFQSLEKLKNASANEQNAGFIGNISLIENDRGELLFHRKILFSDSEDQANNDEYSTMMMSIFGNYFWTYKIHLPYKILNANTSEENIDYKNKTITWNFSLASIMNEPQIMKATLAKPWFNLKTVIILIGTIGLLGLISIIIRKKS